MRPTLTVNYGIANMDDTSLLYSPACSLWGVFTKVYGITGKTRFRTYTAETFAISKRI